MDGAELQLGNRGIGSLINQVIDVPEGANRRLSNEVHIKERDEVIIDSTDNAVRP